MIVFISCVKKKRNQPCKAEEMYVSPLFQKSLAYAKSLKPRKIYILSALYGVLELDDKINPYEKTLLKMNSEEKKDWANKVCRQLTDKEIDFTEKTVFLCGNEYRKYLIHNFPNNEIPLKSLGIGQQLAFYKSKLNEV